MNPRKGDVIKGLPKDTDDAVVFHAGTALQNEAVVTTGGRVLCVTVLADKVALAQTAAYEVARGIAFDGAQFRKDIGWRAIRH
jgi:phosphoribosylamine--glycine ligase